VLFGFTIGILMLALWLVVVGARQMIGRLPAPLPEEGT